MLIFVVVFLASSPQTGKTLIGLPPLFGLDPASGEDARITGPIAALWYLVFIMPMFLFTPDQARGQPLRQAVGSGLTELKSTLREVRKRPGIVRFLAARLVYQDGLNAIVALGAGYAASLFHWSINEIGLFGMITNVSAILSCLVAARLDARLGSKAIVLGSLVLLLIASFGIVSTGTDYFLLGLLPVGYSEGNGLFSTAAEQAFLVYGLMIGAALGPVQASARSWFARSIRPEESGRYFGIYALAGRATGFLGPFLVATITALTGCAAIGMSVLLLFLSWGSIWLPLRLIRPTGRLHPARIDGPEAVPALWRGLYSIQPMERCTAFSHERNRRVLSSTGIRGCQRWPTCQFSTMSRVDFQ